MLFGLQSLSGQYLLQAPNSTDEHNYRWFEASDRTTVLGTEFFLEVQRPGVYFATFDGTLCGANATGYFIVTDCSTPNNEVTLDISNSTSNSSSVSWSPTISGDALRPMVLADQTVTRYTATIQKAGNSFSLPNFTVVCMQQASTLVDDNIELNEDTFITISIFDNDTNLPTEGTLSLSNPMHGTVQVDDNGTPNDPSDDTVLYTPNPDYNGSDSFNYTVCNTNGDCSTATVNINVLPIVDAVDDSVAAKTNESLPIAAWSFNDNDVPTLGSFTATQPANGVVVINDNGTPNDPSDDFVLYTANPDFTGTDTFTYTVCDTLENCDTATVTVAVSENSNVNLDADNDGILDVFEDLNLDGDDDPSTNPTDTDEDGIPDYLDIDSDNDGIPDNVEAQTSAAYIAPSGIDANDNGVDDAYESNGILGLNPEDTDGDGLPDYVDVDSDNDSILDAIEAHDFNHDGIADITISGADSDGDGLDDAFEGDEINDTDVNDEFDIPLDNLPDTDVDSVPDYRDADDDDDGIATIDEDTNEDGNYQLDDFDADGIPDYLDPDVITTTLDDIEVFNALSPNGDGIQDTLRIDGLQNYPNNSIRIYNRWGVKVFGTQAYGTSGNVFDGTSLGRVTVNKDNQLPVGTYFYILEFEDDAGISRSMSGYIYINR